MRPFRIKVCGITRARDAALAESLGVDMIGMIFFRKSPRFVNLGQATAICQSLSSQVQRVGVFVNEAREQVLEIAQRLDLDFVQLHGTESARDISYLQKHGLRVIKAFAISETADFDAVVRSRADLRLIDNRVENQAGGTGRRFDWSLRPSKPIDRLVVAGGLDVDNVAEAVKLFKPAMVDVNSGVEDSPGIKSSMKLTRFFVKCNELIYGR